jgi:hypothetical protein
MNRIGAAAGVMLREMLRPKRSLRFENREGVKEYDFVLPGKRWRKGVSAMLRVKNEERKIVLCLASILDVFAEIVLIDNGSTDSTVELVRAFAQQTDRRGKLTLFSYPFDVARCGEEHRSTPADSVHSLAYYYNWCLSKCRRSYVFKVDADMVVSTLGARRLPKLFARLSPLVPTIIEPSVQTMYHSPDGRWFLSTDEIHREPRLFPNTSTIRFHKAKHSEVLGEEIPTARSVCEDVFFYELKDTTEDEFLHWTDRRFPTERKQQEWRNFNLVKSGAISDGAFVEVSPPFATSTIVTDLDPGSPL